MITVLIEVCTYDFMGIVIYAPYKKSILFIVKCCGI